MVQELPSKNVIKGRMEGRMEMMGRQEKKT
jgi:hypothetical protein